MANLQIMKHYARHPREFVMAVLHKLWSIRPIRMVGATLRNLFHVNRIEKRVGELEQKDADAAIQRLKGRISLIEASAAGKTSPAAELLKQTAEAHAKNRETDPEWQAVYSRITEELQKTNGEDLQTLVLNRNEENAFLLNCQSGSIDLIIMEQLTEQLTTDELIRLLEECTRALRKDGKLVIQAPDPECTEGYHMLSDPTFATVLRPEAMAMLAKNAGMTKTETVRLEKSADGCADYVMIAG